MREHLATFLAFNGTPSEAELDLWEAALAPAGGDLIGALATWLRVSDQKPQPIEILRIMQAHEQPISMRRIALDVAMKHEITIEELTGPKRHQRQAHPRQEAMFKMKRAGYSYSEIGRFFGRDHTTVMHGVRAHEARQIA